MSVRRDRVAKEESAASAAGCVEPLERRTLLAWNPAGALIDQDDATAAYPNITGKNVTVAVIDTGVDYNHPALGGGFGPGKKVKAGFDFVSNDGDPMDTFGHGTQVAGIIAAAPFSIGDQQYQGIAPDADLVALRVSAGGDVISDARIEQALKWIIDNHATHGISVVNFSFGGGRFDVDEVKPTTSDELAKLKQLGILVVSPGGNEGTAGGAGIHWPAADPSVAAVGSVALNDQISTFTSRGKLLDLLAPGESVGTTGLGGGSSQVSLTSFSSPFVAGAAALLKQAAPSLRGDDLVSVLRASGARKDDSSFGVRRSYSRIDLDNAITLAFQRGADLATNVGNLGAANDMAYDRDGVLHLAYYDPGIRNIRYATRSTAGLWSATRLIDTTGNDAGATLSLALDPTGKPAIAYYDATEGDSEYARFDGIAWKRSTIDAKNIAGQFPSLAFDNDGNPVVAYYRKTSGDLRVMRHDGTQWVRNEVDTADNVGQFNSLAVSPNGTIGVAYANATTGDVKYAQLGGGATWTTEVVDDLRGAAFISLAFNAGNQPAVSYYDAYPADLKFASRSTGPWQAQTVATKGAQGLFTSLWFDNSARPNIVYYSRKSDAIFRVAADPAGAWTVQTTRLNAGPSGSAAPKFDGAGGSYSWWSDEKQKLLTADV
ncbi:MAG TPA: S8 family serine peptidase [Tepidisphaeraceae bacterium]|nr:S8 family serine peptidase [Tepidisphaeraceae bacterium]